MTLKSSINFIVILTIAIFLSSCGANAIKEKTIKANGVSISGEGSKYIKVVDGDYTLKVVEDKIVIPIKLELTQKYIGKNTTMGNLTFIPLDGTGIAVADIGLDMSPATMSDWDKISELLKGEVGKTSTISFKWDYFSDKKVQARIMKETEKFELTRADFTGSSTSGTSSTDNNKNTPNETTLSKDGSENWDKMLDDYNDYVDKYVVFYKKAMNGDQDAMTEYPALLQKSTDLAASISKAQGDNKLSTKQINRMVKIQSKMLSAIPSK